MQAIFLKYIQILLPILLLIAALYLLLCIIYYLLQEKFIFIPSFKNQEKLKIKVDYEEIFLEGERGGSIHAFHLKIANPRGCILYFHGNTGSLQRWGVIAQSLTKFGYNVFIPDYRGYGKSCGIRTEELMHNDSLLCLDYLKTKFPIDEIVIYGRSLGSGLAVKLASQENPKALILETPYNNLIDAAKKFAPFIPVKMLLKFTFKSDMWIGVINCPVFIFHGTKDSIISFQLGKKLFEAANGKNNVHFYQISGGKHNNLASFHLFREKLKEILS